MKAEEKSDYMESYHKSLKETEEMMHIITVRNQIFNNVEGAVLEMHEWDKQRFIEKVLDYLKENMIGLDMGKYPMYSQNFINDIKKSMEDML